MTLLELNTLIRSALQDAFPASVWVVAEISEMKVNRSGHCYLELIEKDEATDELTARARATIWSYTFRMVRPYFETTTGQRFTEGIKILAQVSVDYHPSYGLSLNIKDIDPTYTLGDLSLKRREIIRRLEEAGVFHMNRELPLPLVPQRIAVISSATAAGYQDFTDQLAHNAYGFHFEVRLFEAFMQGSEAVPSILSALDAIFHEEEAFDAVAIELRKFREKRADKVIRVEPLPQLRGVVSKVFPELGYGFILKDGGGDVYFHKNALKGIAFTEMEDGVEVLFESEPGEKGLHATIVQPPHLPKL